jgi:hypothetical protein
MFDETKPDDPVTNTPLQPATPTVTRLSDDSPDAARYRAILQRQIDEGAKRAADVITTIERDQPRDQIVRARAAGFDVAPTHGVRVRIADDWYQPTEFALGQIAARAGVPLPYLRELAAPQSAPWKHQLASEILGQHHGNAGDVRVLVRSVRGQLRGNGTHSFRTFALRVVCLNGMTRENLLKQVHLGAGRRAMSKTQLSTATRALPKQVQKSVVDAFESPDVINLPEGNTAWRASNAISWVARHTEDAEMRLDLERAAGALV